MKLNLAFSIEFSRSSLKSLGVMENSNDVGVSTCVRNGDNDTLIATYQSDGLDPFSANPMRLDFFSVINIDINGSKSNDLITFEVIDLSGANVSSGNSEDSILALTEKIIFKTEFLSSWFDKNDIIKIDLNACVPFIGIHSQVHFKCLFVRKINFSHKITTNALLKPCARKQFVFSSKGELKSEITEDLSEPMFFNQVPQKIMPKALRFWKNVSSQWNSFFSSPVKELSRRFISEREASSLGYVKFSFNVLRLAKVECNISLLERSRNAEYKKTTLGQGFSQLKQVRSLLSAQAKKVLSSPANGLNIYAKVYFFDSQINRERFIGRTNVEYRTFDAVFGSNTNSAFSEDGKPITTFVGGPNVTAQGTVLQFYAPKDTLSCYIRVDFFHEKYSLTTGSISYLLFSDVIRYPFADAKDKLVSTENKRQNGLFSYSLKVGKEDSPAKEGNGYSDKFVANVCNNFVQLSEESIAEFLEYFKEIQKILSLLVDESNKAVHSSTMFKPSTSKQKVSMACFATNLHSMDYLSSEVASTSDLLSFEVEKPDEISVRYTFVTCGVPSGLGLMNSGLEFSKTSLAELGTELSKVFSASSEDVPKLAEKLINYESFVTNIPEGTDILVGLKMLAFFYLRLTVALSQMLSVVLTNISSQIRYLLEGHDSYLSFLKTGKISLFFESLISSTGKELTMLEDFHVIAQYVEALYSVTFTKSKGVRRLELTEERIEVFLTEAEFLSLQAKGLRDTAYPLVLCSFTQGINEVQSLAMLSNKFSNEASNILGKFSGSDTLKVAKDSKLISMQKTMNKGSLEKLALLLKDAGCDDVLQKLGCLISQQSSGKSVKILHLSNHLILQLLSTKTVFCKSGKDRTAMAVTYEEAALLSMSENKNTSLVIRESLLFSPLEEGSKQELDLLSFDCDTKLGGKTSWDNTTLLNFCSSLREQGVRLIVAEKNVGNRLYSFNRIQLQFLPKEFQPPKRTIQSLLLSFKARDS